MSASGGNEALSREEPTKTFPGLDIVEQIGRGGMGVIYKVRQRSSGLQEPPTGNGLPTGSPPDSVIFPMGNVVRSKGEFSLYYLLGTFSVLTALPP